MRALPFHGGPHTPGRRGVGARSKDRSGRAPQAGRPRRGPERPSPRPWRRSRRAASGRWPKLPAWRRPPCIEQRRPPRVARRALPSAPHRPHLFVLWTSGFFNWTLGNWYLEDVPLGHIYEVADELRRRARTCLELAEALERRARACRPARSGREPSGLVDDALETVAETGEAGRRG